MHFDSTINLGNVMTMLIVVGRRGAAEDSGTVMRSYGGTSR